jgi:hypothetical protein
MFQNSIDIYNAILTELNKEYNASFEVWDYNYFLNKAISEWVKRKYAEYETTQKRTDDLQLITKRNHKLNIVDNISPLPSDYLFLLGVRGEIEGKTKCTDGFLIKEIYKTTSDLKGYSDSNYYAKLKSWYEITHNTINIIPEKNTKIKTIYIEYIETPLTQGLDLDNVTSPTNNLITLLTKDYIALEIIKLCASMFLENIEQQRTQGHLQLNEQVMIN